MTTQNSANDWYQVLILAREIASGDIKSSNELLSIIDEIIEINDSKIDTENEKLLEISNKILEIAKQLTDRSKAMSIAVTKLVGAA